MEPEKREALIARLSSVEEEERRSAMEALKESLSENDLDWLSGPLSDESWRVRKEGIEGLSRLVPTPALVSALVPLMDPEMELTLRNSVVEVLEKMGSQAAGLLVEYLDVEQSDVRKFLVDILGNIAHPDTVPALVDLLGDPEDNIKAAAAEALAAIGDPSVCRNLLAAMEGANEWFIYSLIGTLARLKCRDALPVFFKYLDSQLLSKPALEGVGAMGNIEDGIRLMEKAASLSRGAAKSAFIAAGSIYRRSVSGDGPDHALNLREALSAACGEQTIESLISQLEVTDVAQEQKDIIAALGMSGTELSLEPILGFVEDDTFSREVDLALLTLGQKSVDLITRLLNHHDPLVRQRGVRTLENLGDAGSLEEIYRLLEDESGNVRKDAAAAVSSLGDTGSIDKLLPVLEDEYGDVAQSAAQALVRLGQKSPEVLALKITPMLLDATAGLYSLLIMILTEVQAPGWEELCLKAAQSTEAEVRAAAVSCLKRSAKSVSVSMIFNSLADESSLVRAKAVVTLEELKHPEAIAPLKAAMHDHDPWVRTAAVSALSVQPDAAPSDFEELLAGDDLMMQSSVLDALGRMAASGRKDALDVLVRQFEAGATETRRSICRLLDKVKDTAAFDLLLKAMKDPDPSVRVFAVHALSQRPEEQIPAILSEAMEKDSEKQVREAIRAALEGRG